MKCPSCGVDIKVSMMDIITIREIVCPACGLRMQIDRTKSDKAIRALRKVAESREKY